MPIQFSIINQDQAYRSRRQAQSKALTNLALSFRGATFLIRFTLLYPVISLSLLTLNSAQATQWTGNTSTDWNNATNWNNNVPTSSTDATIDFDGSLTSSPYTATIINGITAQTRFTIIGDSGSGTVNLSGGSLSSSSTYIGTFNGSNGTVNLSGGSLSSSSYTIIGNNSGSSGTLNIGADSLSPATTPGTITGAILFRAGTGTLNFKHTSTGYTVNNSLSDTSGQTPNGASAVNIIAGRTIFTGTKSYSPQTNVSGGELELQTSLPNSNIDIGASGTVTFNPTGNSTYSKVISGDGTLNKSGAGTLTLSGDSNGFTGTTTISGGELKLLNAGSNLGGDITIQSGATISGNGTTGNLTIDSGGVVAPGNSIGTLHVAGDYIQNGTYNCEVNGVTGIPVAGTDNDLIAVTGNATLGGTLHVIPSGVFANGQSITYTVLTSTGLGGSSFTSVTGTSPLFTYQANYTGTDAQLTLTKTYNISQIVTEGNLGSVANYMDTHAPASLKSRLNSLTTEQLKQALSDLDPAEETQKTDFIASIESASMATPFTWSGMDRLVKQSGQAMAALVHQVSTLKQSFTHLFGKKRQHRTVMQALSSASDPKQIPISARVNMGVTNLWIQGGVGRFSQESTMDPSSVVIQGLDGNTYDTSVGLDHAISNTLKIGIVTGYTVSQYTMKADRSKGSVNSARFGIYGLWEAPSSWYVNSAIYYGHHRFKSDRLMTFVPTIAHQRHDGHHISGLTEVGKDITLAQSIVLTPYVGVGALFLRENGYTEYGAGVQNLSVKGRNSTTLQGKGGVQLANLWHWHDETPIYSFARLGLTYRRAVGSHQKLSASLVGQGGTFTVRTRNRDRVLANPSVGFTASLCKDISATLAYEGELGSNQRNHQALVRVNWTF